MDSTTEDGGVVVALPTIDHDDSEASSNQDHIMEGENSGSTTTLSKNAQKRILRDQRRLEAKADRKAREKAMRAEKRKEKKRLAQDEGILEETRLYKKPRLGLGKKNAFNARVVIDLGFDDKMSDKASVE
jgi:tRNA (guanine9-N1)-methyltransferase